MFELHLQRKGGTVYTHKVTTSSVQIGRAPNNDLVLADPMVSQLHAVVWVQDGTLRVRDLGSRNGTFVGGERIGSPQMVQDGEEIKVGPDVTLRVVRGVGELGTSTPGLIVEEVASGLCAPAPSSRFHIGSAADADLRVEGPDRLGTLILHDNGEIWLGTDDDEHPVEVGEAFELAGRSFLVRPGGALRAPTLQPRTEHYPYDITATLSGPTGPQATITNTSTGETYTVVAENRAILMYLLARQVVRDHDARLPETDIGWCTDDDVRVGVWGRGAGEDNKLHVLVYRLRNELKRAGFDPWFVEKRRKYIRARVVNAVIR